MTRNWKETPGKRALVLGMFASIVIARWIHHTFFSGSDGRLEDTFIFIAIMANAYAYVLIYRREMLRSLRDELLSSGIVAAGFGAGIWVSFSYFDSDSFLSYLPIYAGLLVGVGPSIPIRKWFRKA